MVCSHAGIYKSEMIRGKSLRVASPERPEMGRRDTGRRRHSQYDKILDQAWLPTLLWAKGEPGQESGQPAHLFGNPWPPDPRTVLNHRAPRSRGPPARWFLEVTLARVHPRLLPHHLLHSPQPPYCEG